MQQEPSLLSQALCNSSDLCFAPNESRPEGQFDICGPGFGVLRFCQCAGKSEEGRLSREKAVVGFESGIILFGEF